MSQIESTLDQLASLPRRNPWVWPISQVVLGFGALGGALLFYPGAGGEWVYVFGYQFGGPCGFEEATGLGCPSCGMTRSWVHLARLHLVQAFTYNAAGALLLLGLVGSGVQGLVRLITRDPKKWRVPFNWVSSVVIAWMVGPYLGMWILRLLGVNAL